MEVGSALVADSESLELVQPGEGTLDYPAHLAETGAVCDTAAGDDRLDAAFPEQAEVLVEVVAPIGVHAPRLAAGTSPPSADWRDRVQQGKELGDVVAVPAGDRDGERGSMAVDQVVLGAGAGAVDRRGADMVPPFEGPDVRSATEQSSSSSRSERRISVGRAACRRGPTPASVQSRRRRQAVTPEQPTTSLGTSRQTTPLRGT